MMSPMHHEVHLLATIKCAELQRQASLIRQLREVRSSRSLRSKLAGVLYRVATKLAPECSYPPLTNAA